MNTFNRKVSAIAGLLALGLFSILSVNANAAEADPSCHQETRRVAVWPVGPKSQQPPRFETRTRMVCDQEKVASKPDRTASKQTFGPRQR